jgi:hypothetical protein
VTTIRLATSTDDAALRRFMRSHGMAAWVEMAIEREPSFFAGRDFGGQEWAVIAEEETDIVGMYSAALRPVHVNGKEERVGYLGGLRVSPNYRHRIRYLRQGYASIRALTPAAATLPWWFTVIAADNTAARKLLEAGIPGLPDYHALGDYVTYALPTSRGERKEIWRPAEDAEVDALAAFYNAQASRFNFTPVLDSALIRRIGVKHFHAFERGGVLQGVAALWDQRSFKQIVAARYRRPIGRLVPMYNCYAKLFRRIPLPRQGHALDHTFVAFLALRDEARSDSRPVLRDLLSQCKTPIASVGLHAAHSLTEILMGLKPVRYPARVYGVTFEPGTPASDRPIQPEAALL